MWIFLLILTHHQTSGSSSGVEHQLPKLRVAGSNPVSRSIFPFPQYIRRVAKLDLVNHSL